MEMIPRDHALVPVTTEPTLVWCPHPMLADIGRQMFSAAFLPGESIAAYLRRVELHLANRPVVLCLNGQVIDRTEWVTIYPQSGDIITVRARLQNGGDGDSNKVLRTVLTIAVILVAVQFGGALAPHLWAGATEAMGTALISIGGSLLINALLPPPGPQLRNAQGLGQSSPTYALSGGQNRARLFEPMPLIIGTHRVYPDLGAKTYTEFQGNDQYLYLALNFGLNGQDVSFSSWQVGDTPTTSFQDFNQTNDLQIAGANGKLTLFPSNVDTLNVGAQLTGPTNLVTNGRFDDWTAWTFGGRWRKSGYFANHQYWALDGYDTADSVLQQNIAPTSGQVYRVDYTLLNVSSSGKNVTANLAGTNGTPRSASGRYVENITAGATGLFKATANYQFVGALDSVQVTLNDGSDWQTRTSSANTTALAVDLSGYLFYTTPDGMTTHTIELEIEYRTAGSGSFVPYNGTDGLVVLTNSDRTPIRKTIKWSVTEGQYDVRVRRITAAEGDAKYTSDITWTALRSYQPDAADYTGQARAAIRLRASGQMQGSIDAINALATALCEAWNGSGWSKTANSNPGWWFRWFALGKKNTSGQRIYGGGYTDAELDLAAIKAWGAWCTTKGLGVNLVLDGAMSVLDVLQAIARCGRASVTWGTGKLGIIWDADAQPVTAVFCMSNIVADSFSIDYITGQLADEIIVEFMNPALGYKPDTVRATVPGVITPVNPVKMQIFGLTDKVQAGKEANLVAAAQAYRRRRITWDSDFEGMTSRRGDVVTLSHDLTQWDYSGRLVAGTTTVLTLSRKVPFTPSTQHYVGIRKPDGIYNIYSVVYQAGESDTITLASSLPSAPDADIPRDWLWFFGPQATPGKKVKIIDITPQSESRVRIVATDEDPAYYAAESGAYQYVNPAVYGQQYPTLSGLETKDTITLVGGGWAVTISVVWAAVGEYMGAWVRWRRAGEEWHLLGSFPGRTAQFQSGPTGTIEVEVIGFNKFGRSGASSRVSASYNIVGDDDPIEDIPWLIAAQNGDLMQLTWGEVSNIDKAGYEFRRYPDVTTDYVKAWNEGAPVLTSAPGNAHTTALIPPGKWIILGKAFDINATPIYSVNPTIDRIDFVSTYDVIDSYAYAPDFLGTLDGFVKHWTGVMVPMGRLPMSAYGWEGFDICVPDPVDTSTYTPPEIDIGIDNNVRAFGDVDYGLCYGNTSAGTPVLQLDYRTTAGAYDGFENWSIGIRNARYFQFRVTMDNTAGVGYLKTTNATVDLKERSEKFENIAVSASGTAIVFAQPFHRTPFPLPGLVAGGPELQTHYDTITTTGATAYIYNTTTHAYVAGTISKAEFTGV
ncbi:MAG: hypothetical protein HY272_02030 [Gammaproteobacteria bacterium]|nr:hypothetical protein [Gammaproteobacteria bacterium]